MREQSTAFRFQCSRAPHMGPSAPTFPHSCVPWWRVDGSAFRRGSAARHCTYSFDQVWPGWAAAIPGSFGGHTVTEWISFLLFWGLNVIVIYRGMDLLRKVENWAAPFVLVMTALLVWWALDRANGLGPILAQKGKFGSWREFWPVFVPSLTAMIG